MKHITIVGAGQSGLQLGIGLLQNGYRVTLVTDRTGEQIANGPVMSTQCMFHSALESERALALNHWEQQCPKIEAINLCVTHPESLGEKVINWRGGLSHFALSVDQRIKFPNWMDKFEELGGDLVVKRTQPSDLDQLGEQSDLLILATGKAELANLFERDSLRSPFERPQRKLVLLYLQNPQGDKPLDNVSFNVIPGAGEFFIMPALSHNGACEAMLFEVIPDGPLDCFEGLESNEQVLEKARSVLNTYLPWEAQRIEQAVLTDDNAVISGSFVPTVRKPVAKLASGKLVFGLGDTLCLNDPITGQGANNAAKAAQLYLERIISHGQQAFDEQWMTETFEQFWQYAQWPTTWSNMMLAAPPEFVLNLLGAAGQYPKLANRIVNAFDDPADLFPWFSHEEHANAYLAELSAV
ncbi:styrene monooxygenase/indole monooxygenase family protein [Vibrio paucivorans]